MSLVGLVSPHTTHTESSAAPVAWAEHCSHRESKLHQLSPYIGKLKSTIAGDLLATYTREGDVVLDPFCGSGTVPLEAALRGRTPLGMDQSIYAFVLARGKLCPPPSRAEGVRRLERILLASRTRRIDLRAVPKWVRAFFHPETLREAIRFADECIERREFFLLACLLGILHHQRPGFLSFPSSHLVPYLRTRKFPRCDFPEMYEHRDLASRILKKLERALADSSDLQRVRSSGGKVRRAPVERLRLTTRCDAIITSPPYMNALDYVRDNRLCMWFLDRSTTDYSPEPTDKHASFRGTIRGFARRALPALRIGGTCVLVIGESVSRKRMLSHPAEDVLIWLEELAPCIRLERIVEDTIPDVRRARRDGGATKKELVLVYRKVAPLTRG